MRPVGEQRLWWQERWFAVSASFVAVLVLAAVIVIATSTGAGSSTAAATPTRITAPGGSAPPAAAAGGCDLPAGDQSVPTSGPQAGWELVGSMAAPRSGQIGPQRTVDGIRECFADSPIGALYAAVNVLAEGTAESNVTVLQALAADTAVKATAVRQAQADERDGQATRVDAGSRVQVAGFAVTGYDQQNAQVTIVLQNQDGAYVAVPLLMRWLSDDWRFVIPPAGGAPGVAQIPDLTGYIAWGGA